MTGRRDLATAAPVVGEAVHVGRQPIVDKHLRVAGFEILFRDGTGRMCGPDGHPDLSRAVTTRLMLDFGLDLLVGEVPAYVNVDRELLVSGDYRALPPERVVLEILESVELDDEAIACVALAKQAGYRIALDDVVAPARLGPAREFVDLVKVDVLAAGVEALPDVVRALRRFSPRPRLLAEKVETSAELACCRALGFDLFQGFAYARPEVVSARVPGGDVVAALRLLRVLDGPDPDVGAVVDAVEADPVLAYRLLRLANAAYFSSPAQVTSIHQAVVWLGLGAVRRLATLLAVAGVGSRNEAALRSGVLRGGMAAHLAARDGESATHTAFTVGSLSVLDALFGQPLANLVAPLPLEPTVARALVDREGPLGRLLTAVIDYEQGVDVAAGSLFTSDELGEAYGQGLAQLEALRPCLTSAA